MTCALACCIQARNNVLTVPQAFMIPKNQLPKKLVGQDQVDMPALEASSLLRHCWILNASERKQRQLHF